MFLKLLSLKKYNRQNYYKIQSIFVINYLALNTISIIINIEFHIYSSLLISSSTIIFHNNLLFILHFLLTFPLLLILNELKHLIITMLMLFPLNKMATLQYFLSSNLITNVRISFLNCKYYFQRDSKILNYMISFMLLLKMFQDPNIQVKMKWELSFLNKHLEN